MSTHTLISTSIPDVAAALHDTTCCTSATCWDWQSGRYERWAHELIADLTHETEGMNR